MSARVVIIGAGPGGLALAVALERAGFDPVVFERRHAEDAYDGAIGLWWNGISALHELGLYPALIALTRPITSADYRNWQGHLLAHLAPNEFLPGLPGPFVAILRRDLCSLLRSALKSTKVNYGYECMSFMQSESGVCVNVSEHSPIQGEVLVGADGVNSRIRSQLFPRSMVRVGREMGWTGIAEGIPNMTSATYQHLAGRSGAAFWAPLKNGSVFWGAVSKSNPVRCRYEADLQPQAVYADWWPPLLELFKATQKVYRFNLTRSDDLESWTSGRVTLLGDAAHAMPLHLAQGTSQALEDGIYFARALLSESDPRKALLRYERTRLRRTKMIVGISRLYARSIPFQDPLLRLFSRGGLSSHMRRLLLERLRNVIVPQEQDSLYFSPIDSAEVTSRISSPHE